MVDRKLSEVLSTNPATAPTGTEPVETVQSATSAAFTFAELANHPLNPQVGTTYTLALTDQGKAVTMDNAATNTCTIPLNATVAFHIGARLIVRQIGAGLTTLAAAGGVTIEKVAGVSLTMSEAHEQLILHKVAADTWHVFAGGSGGAGGAATVAFHGALVERTTTLARTSTPITATVFVAEVYDTDGFATLGTNDDRVTVPSGVTKVQLSAMMGCTDCSGRKRLEVIHKNSGGTTQRRYGGSVDNTETDNYASLVTQIIPVSSGDYFELYSDSADASWTQQYASLAIEYKDGTLTESAEVLTTKGDIIAFSTVPARLPVGADGQVLKADSAEATGVKWSTSSGSCRVVNTATQVLDGNDDIIWDASPTYDDDTWYDSGVSTIDLVIPAGVTRIDISCNAEFDDVNTGTDIFMGFDHRDSGGSFIAMYYQMKTNTVSILPSVSGTMMGFPVTAGESVRVRIQSVDTTITLTKAQCTIRDVSP